MDRAHRPLEPNRWTVSEALVALSRRATASLATIDTRLGQAYVSAAARGALGEVRSWGANMGEFRAAQLQRLLRRDRSAVLET
jgi:hypothetical protein